MAHPKFPGYHTIEQTPSIFENILMDATEEQLHWKPSSERWSISEVFSHLTDVETQVIRARIQKMVAEDNPALASYDQNEKFTAGRYSSGTGRENLGNFRRERERSLDWLRRQPLTILERTARHPEVGTIQVSNLLHIWAFHDLGHIRQVSELYRAEALFPGMGPLQRFYKVNP